MLLHSREVFDVGGAFATSLFGSRAMQGVFCVLASFLTLAIGLPHPPELLTLALGWLSPCRVRVSGWKPVDLPHHCSTLDIGDGEAL